eukprot:753000-Hanusia_phi.AAC.7
MAHCLIYGIAGIPHHQPFTSDNGSHVSSILTGYYDSHLAIVSHSHDYFSQNKTAYHQLFSDRYLGSCLTAKIDDVLIGEGWRSERNFLRG